MSSVEVLLRNKGWLLWKAGSSKVGDLRVFLAVMCIVAQWEPVAKNLNRFYLYQRKLSTFNVSLAETCRMSLAPFWSEHKTLNRENLSTLFTTTCTHWSILEFQGELWITPTIQLCPAPPYSKLHHSTLQNYVLYVCIANICMAMKTMVLAMKLVIKNRDGRSRISAAENSWECIEVEPIPGIVSIPDT